MNEKTPRSQLVAKLKSANNILVTVSRNPSVDQLATALALTFALVKMDKHATAVFSGDTPSAINFLEPEKIFTNSVDSLRDFVISLDKEKADRLRYKVEGDFVKIYITPYKTTISEKDLEFNEGDFNIELVIAVGVKEKDHLDEAISAHGKLLHDATVATLSLTDNKKGLFGSINWQNVEAGSLSEMVADLIDDLSDDKKPLLDEPIATALLTGVVAATDQFRNDKTSASVMTLAANLMAKGANQQLIASELSAGASSISTSDEDDTDDTDEVVQMPSKDEINELSLDHELTSETDDYLAKDTEEVAAEHNDKALSEAREQLETVIENNPNDESSEEDIVPAAEDRTLPVPQDRLTTEETVTSGSLSEDNSNLDPNNNILSSEAELDNVVATNTNTVGIPMSHSTPYAESAIGSPLNAAISDNTGEPALIDPFAAASSTAAPMINTISPPPAILPSDTPSIDLPPPPPLPAPDLGQLPPASLVQQTTDSSQPQFVTPAQEQSMGYAAPQAADPMFPSVDPNPTDSVQYQIPPQ